MHGHMKPLWFSLLQWQTQQVMLQHITNAYACAGTFVNGQRLGKKERTELTNDTSIVTFGTCPLQFQVKCELTLLIKEPCTCTAMFLQNEQSLREEELTKL